LQTLEERGVVWANDDEHRDIWKQFEVGFEGLAFAA
jgi:hypothetical protein